MPMKDTIAAIRREAGLTQEEMARMLSESGAMTL